MQLKFHIRVLVAGIFVAASCLVGLGRLPATTDESAAEIKTGTISGRVVSDSGQPLAGASVFVRAFASGAQGRNTTTDGEGNFQVSGLDRAQYIVSASLPAYVRLLRGPDEAQPSLYRIGESVKVELTKGGVITGTVTTSSGEPVVGIHVRAYMIRQGDGQPPRYMLQSVDESLSKVQRPRNAEANAGRWPPKL